MSQLSPFCDQSGHRADESGLSSGQPVNRLKHRSRYLASFPVFPAMSFQPQRPHCDFMRDDSVDLLPVRLPASIGTGRKRAKSHSMTNPSIPSVILSLILVVVDFSGYARHKERTAQYITWQRWDRDTFRQLEIEPRYNEGRC
jgi:hypothetical protein